MGLGLTMVTAALGGGAQALSVGAQAAVVFERETGQVLFAQNERAKLPMASTTKVMTALLAIEKGDFSDIVVVPAEGSGVEGSSMYLEVGEHITLENLLYGLMLRSGNDAAVTIAIHIGGSVEGFVEMMNQKAKEIGANDTHFANPNGLPNDDHYTTAYDLGLIATYAMRNETFAKIVGTKERTIPWAGHEWDRVMYNSNKMLSRYEGANGIKTGYTKKAGRCLVTGAERGDIQLISVVLNAGDMYGDSAAILDEGFSLVSLQPVLNKGQVLGEVPVAEGIETQSLELVAQDDILLPIKEGQVSEVETVVTEVPDLQAPVEAGQVIGKVELYFQGKCVGSQELVAQQSVTRITYGYFVEKVIQEWLAGLVKAGQRGADGVPSVNAQKDVGKYAVAKIFGASGGSLAS